MKGFLLGLVLGIYAQQLYTFWRSLEKRELLCKLVYNTEQITLIQCERKDQ